MARHILLVVVKTTTVVKDSHTTQEVVAKFGIQNVRADRGIDIAA